MSRKRFLASLLICAMLFGSMNIPAFAAEEDELTLIPKTFDVGNEFSAAIDEDGDLYTWGKNQYGALGSIFIDPDDPDLPYIDITGMTEDFPSQVWLHHEIVSVATSSYQAFAIDEYGQLYFWGKDVSQEWGGFDIYDGARFVDPHIGQPDLYEMVEPDTLPETYVNSRAIKYSYRPILLDENRLNIDEKLVSVVAEDTHILLITENGALYGCGNNDNGQILNSGSHYPYKIFDSGVVDVATSPTLTAVLKSDGSVWVFGKLKPGSDPLEAPLKVMDNAVAVAAGDYTAFAVGKNGTLYAMGSNATYALGLSGQDDYFDTMEAILPDTDISNVEVYRNSGIAIKESGETIVWGNNANNKLGARERTSYHEQNLISYSAGVEENIFLAAMGEQHSLMITKDDRFIALGDFYADGEYIGIGSLLERSKDFIEIIDGGVEKAIAGQSQSLALMKDGSVWVWGSTSYLPPDAELDFRAYYNRPYKIMDNIVDIYGYMETFYAVTEDGELISWGKHHDIAGNKKAYPKTIISKDMEEFSDLEIVNISLGSSTTYMIMKNIKTDEYSYYAWGYNLGRYGDGTSARFDYPKKIELDGLEFVHVAGGASHALALTKDGKLYSWGDNMYGQASLQPELEGEYYKTIKEPTHILVDETFKSIQAFSDESLALTTDGRMYGFGRNLTGSAGLGDTSTSRPEGIYPPEIVTEGQESDQIGGFDELMDHGLATSSVNLWGWGWNTSYHLYPKDEYKAIKPVFLMEDVVSASMSHHTLAVKHDGSLWGKGSNSDNELGVYYGELDFKVKSPIPQPVDPSPGGDDETGGISIDLTDDIAAFSGMTMRLLGEDESIIKTVELSMLKSKYHFNNLDISSQYTLELLSPQNISFGKIENIAVTANENKVIDISGFEKPITAEVSVTIAGGGAAPANLYSVLWYDENDQFISTSNKMKYVKPGTIIKYQVKLNNSALKEYQKPEVQSETVTVGNHKYQEVLQPYTPITLSGTIKDENGNPVEGAYISLLQYQGEPQSISSTARSSVDGMFTMKGISGTGTLAIGKSGYASIYQENAQIAADMGTFTLNTLPNTKLLLNISVKNAVISGADQTSHTLNSFDDFEVMVKKQGQVIDNAIIQSPYIYFPAGTVNKEDIVDISIKHVTNKYAPVTENLTINGDYTSLNISITENGYFDAKFQSEKSMNKIFLFDAQGMLVNKYETTIQDGIKSDNLSAAAYKLAFMEDTTTALTPGTIKDFENAGFTEDTDYIIKDIVITPGKITEVEAVIPAVAQGKEFVRNGSMIFIPIASSSGSRMLVRTEFDLLQTDWNNMSSSSIKFSLPKGVSLVTEGITLNNKQINNYSFHESTLSVPLEGYSSKTRCYFYVDTVETGELPINAFLSFNHSNVLITQQISSGYIKLSSATTLNVPSKVNRKTISANGSGRVRADIRLYDNGVLVGETKTNAKGDWGLTFDLFEPYNFTTHKIHAEVKGADGSWIKTESVPVYYNTNEIELKSVIMEASGSTLYYDFYNMPKITPTYIYHPASPACVFKINFDGDPDLVYDVYVHTSTVSNKGESLEAQYDKRLGCWVAATTLSNQNLVTGFEIEFSTNIINDYVYDVEAFNNAIKKHDTYIDYLIELEDEDLESAMTDTSWLFDEINSQRGSIITDLSEEDGDINLKIDGYGYFKEERKTAEGLTEKGLLDDEFDKVTFTDGTIYYMKSDLLNTYYVNLADNEYIVSSFIPDAEVEEGTVVNSIAPKTGEGTVVNSIAPMAGADAAISSIAPMIGAGAIVGLPPFLSKPENQNPPYIEVLQVQLDDLYVDLVKTTDSNKISEILQKIRNHEKLLEYIRQCVEKGASTDHTGAILMEMVEIHLKRLQSYNEEDCKNFNKISEAISAIDRIKKLKMDLDGIEANVTFQTAYEMEKLARTLLVSANPKTDPFRNEPFRNYKEEVNEILLKHAYLEIKSQILNTMIENLLKHVVNVNCVPYISQDTDNWRLGGGNRGSSNPLIDPSGFIYEAVPENFLEGVTTTVVYQGKAGEEVVWDAEEYGQINPQLTDIDGFYAWDVLPGLWKVYAEKEGYITGESEWLPVPPPQLEVNLGLVSLKAPQISFTNAYEDYIEIIFDKYMTPSTLNTDTITLKINDQEEEITIAPIFAEADGGVQYAQVVKVSLKDGTKLSGNIKLTITSAVTSYAGSFMDDEYTEELAVLALPEDIAIAGLDGANNLTIEIYQPTILNVDVEPRGAAKGNKILAEINNAILQLDHSAVIDQNGNAKFTLNGFSEGETSLTLSTADGSITKTIDITVQGIEKVVKQAVAPVASVSSGVVEKGTKVNLRTSTIGGFIKYTIDGQCPLQYGEIYSGPITINETTRIRAATMAIDHEISGPLDITYTVKKEESEKTGGSSSSGANNVTIYEKETEEEYAAPFKDINTHWAKDDIAYMFQNDYMTGISDSYFYPDTSLSRAMLVTILWRIEGEPAATKANAFTDLTAAWYKDAVSWAVEHEIVNGYSETKFGAGDDVTREQMATILYRYSEYIGHDMNSTLANELAKFDDADTVSDYATAPMQWAIANALITGRTETTLAPQGTATRAETAVILHRFLENVAKISSLLDDQR